MSKRKSERLVNLLILLLSTPHFIGKRQIRHTIEGYRELGDQAFDRMFERDKDELRSIGAPISTGSNDPDSDEADGYRINRTDFELPAVSFTPEERAVLGVATQAWQDTVAAAQTAEAMETLRAAGADPEPERAQTLMARLPSEPGFDTCRAALMERRQVEFAYRGEQRRVQPWRLSQRRGRWYLLGYDVDKTAPRHFKLSRLTSEVRVVGPRQAYEPPSAEELAALNLQPDEAATTVHVAVRAGHGGDLRRRGRAARIEAAVPAGFDVIEIQEQFVAGLVGEVCALGSDAVVVSPPSVRAQVVEQLRTVARGAR